jgi:hypothetical protein
MLQIIAIFAFQFVEPAFADGFAAATVNAPGQDLTAKFGARIRTSSQDENTKK